MGFQEGNLSSESLISEMSNSIKTRSIWCNRRHYGHSILTNFVKFKLWSEDSGIRIICKKTFFFFLNSGDFKIKIYSKNSFLENFTIILDHVVRGILSKNRVNDLPEYINQSHTLPIVSYNIRNISI